MYDISLILRLITLWMTVMFSAENTWVYYHRKNMRSWFHLFNLAHSSYFIIEFYQLHFEAQSLDQPEFNKPKFQTCFCCSLNCRCLVNLYFLYHQVSVIFAVFLSTLFHVTQNFLRSGAFIHSNTTAVSSPYVHS